MKAISLWQPWANFVARGLLTPDGFLQKLIETREWETSHRGPIAILAAKKIDLAAMKDFDAPVAPRGVIVAVVDLFDCRPLHPEDLVLAMCHKVAKRDPNFLKNRFGFWLRDVRRTAPLPVRGFQKIFNVPDAFVEQALREAA